MWLVGATLAVKGLLGPGPRCARAESPRRKPFFLWFVTVLGTTVTSGGTILLLYGQFDAAQKRRRS